MYQKIKIKILLIIAYSVIYTFFWEITSLIFENLDNIHAGIIIALATLILTPRFISYRTISGYKISIRWIFSRRPRY